MKKADNKKFKEYLKKVEKGLAEFENRKIYTQLSPEILAAIPDDKLDQAIIDYICTKITDYQSALADVSNMSPGFQMVYSTWALEGEVNNGGFNQFFDNPSSQFADMALRSLKMIDAPDYYEILQTAIKIYMQEKENPVLQKLYSQKTIKAFSKSYKLTSLSECDDPFYKLNGRLSVLRLQYIRSHPENFAGD